MKNGILFLFLVMGHVVCLEFPCDLSGFMSDVSAVSEQDGLQDPPPSPLPPDER